METNKHIIDTTMPDSAQKPDLTANSADPVASTDPQPATSAETTAQAEPTTTQLDPLPENPNQIREDQPAQPILIELPFFLRWQVRNYEQTLKVLGAIEEVFWAFTRSDLGKTLDEDVNKTLAYSCLRMAFEDIVHRAAAQRIESYQKPKAAEYMSLLTLPDLAIGDPQLDSAPVLVSDPTTCTDLDQLHEWVGTLQQMCRIQQKMTSNFEKIETAQSTIIEKQEQQIANLTALLDQYQKKATKEEQEANVPGSQSYVDLTLFFSGGYESEVEYLRLALESASKDKLTKVFQKITVDETEEAFYLMEEYTMLQNILGRLALAVTEQAADNYSRAYYLNHPTGYLSTTNRDRRKQMERKEAFIEAYSVFTEDEETPEKAPIPESAPDTTPTVPSAES